MTNTATLQDLTAWTIGQLDDYVGRLSEPSKMPGFAYSLPAAECATGSRLRAVAGSTCSGCYALKGRYAFPVVRDAMYRRLEALERPLWAEAMAELINRRTAKHPHFRWHDSGDLQSLEHLRAIVRVCELTPTVRHWLPTREYRILTEFEAAGGTYPANLNVRASAHMVGGKAPQFTGRPLTVSTVSREADTYPNAHHCPAPLQGNSCGDCRACWDRTVNHVDYHIH
jgi:hypothetical protein